MAVLIDDLLRSVRPRLKVYERRRQRPFRLLR